jgi:hypothetical protein
MEIERIHHVFSLRMASKSDTIRPILFRVGTGIVIFLSIDIRLFLQIGSFHRRRKPRWCQASGPENNDAPLMPAEIPLVPNRVKTFLPRPIIPFENEMKGD